ncbi:MAG: hypothetical protein B7Z66_10665 [Chromatiales bacterium 21-64-14]|nr:MAG: hypothetical protein B7Z66_10665 [Chromatiales bacterium 21-64-14]HQU15653.1 hypothetical protein [Gammaproteobacteria bacterium]
MRVRTALIVALLLVAGPALAQGHGFIFTSPADYRTLIPVKADSVWQAIPTVAEKTGQPVSFADAYAVFWSDMTARIHAAVEGMRGRADGVANLRIQYQVSGQWYYFSATFDFVKRVK